MKKSNYPRSAAPKVQPTKSARFVSPANILANAWISHDCQKYIKDLDPHARSVIEAASEYGANLVSIRWPTGEFALALCKPGYRRPKARNIIAAYHACQHNSQLSKKGAKP
jgi:hypothetical protein